MKITVSGSLLFDIQDEKSPTFLWSIRVNGVTTKNVTMLTLPTDQKCTASITPVDTQGNPAQIDGLASWSSSNAQIVNVANISPDSLSADLLPGGTLGSAQINVTADADLGSGTKSISGVLDVTVVAGTAVGFVIQTGPLTPVG